MKSVYYAPLPRKSTRADWLADIAAMIGTVVILATVGFFILTGEAPLPDAVKGEDHRAFVAELCPHLTKSACQDCRAWLATGGAK